jgi:hypothetical protein
MKSPSMKSELPLAVALFLSILAAAPGGAQPLEAGQWLAQIGQLQLEPAKAVKVGRLALQLGSAKLRIEEGVFVPATPVGGRVVELVFVGSATLELEPPDEIEKRQLELFTRAGKLAERVTQAILVIAADAPPAAILSRQPAALEPAAAEAARALYAGWRSGPERKQLNVDQALLQDAAGDAAFQGYFAGLFQGDALGRFFYVVDPSEREQSSLGQFVSLPLTRKEQRKLDRELQRQQKRGRLIGLESDDLGSWDSWVSASQGEKGNPRPGHPGFEPRHYLLDAAFEGRELVLRGRAAVKLETVVGGCRAVRLRIHADLRAGAVRRDGQPLFFHQHKGEILVLLPEAPAVGSEFTLEIDYAGDLLDKVSRGYFQLRDTLDWYPHAGEADRATYEVTFHWPRKLQLLAGGEPAGSGAEAGDMLWEKRRSALPTMGIGFEIGRFEISERQVGHVLVRLGLPPVELGDSREESSARILDAVAHSLTYFEEIFGAYPLDRMEVTLTPRLYSQSLLGFMSLSSLMMAEHDLVAAILGLEDPRTVIAHEVAHQWWGHAVGWESYRDLWLSEGLANYSALLFAHNILKDDLRFAIGPTLGWENDLLAETGDGRPLESLGPLVLGTRLDSSKSSDAYQKIVYKKGAIVLSTLAQYFGEDQLIRMLAAIAKAVNHRPISTDTFLALLEKQTDASLESFGRQFVFGTGLPEIYYDYRFARTENGKWRVQGNARQVSQQLYRWRLEELPGGGFDAVRETVELLDVARSRLVVPFEIDLYDPAQKPAAAAKEKAQDKAKDAADPREVGNVRWRGRLLLDGAQGEIDIEVEHEPKTLWLNREKLVFARGLNEVLMPKRTLLFRGALEAGAGHGAEAETLLKQALLVKGYAGPRYADTVSEEARRQDDSFVDGMIHRQLARLALEGGRAAAARQHLDLAADLLKTRFGRLFEDERMMLEARYQLQTGKPAKAFDLLEKRVLGKDAGAADVEAVLLLAIAARASNRPAEARQAEALAQKAGVDVAPLRRPVLSSP